MTMKHPFVFLAASLFASIACAGCQKEETSQLAGTSWECIEDGTILIFNDNKSGLYYCKSAIDDVYDTIFSSFDFIYEISGKEITIEISFTKRTFVMDGIVEDNDTITTNGTINKRHYIRIKHKVPV